MTKTYFGTTEEKRDHPCKVCNQKHPIWECDINVICSREWNIERSGRQQRNLYCVNAVWGKGSLVTHVLGTESVELMDARTDTIGYFMRRK